MYSDDARMAISLLAHTPPHRQGGQWQQHKQRKLRRPGNCDAAGPGCFDKHQLPRPGARHRCGATGKSGGKGIAAAARVAGPPGRRRYSLSMMVTLAMPPPSHMVCRP
jgi:hypothetical protein